MLSGASSQWKNAKPGKVFDTFVNGDYANPVIVVDEIDKASADGQYDPLGALYELLETETATRFVDEFVELPIDASGAVWLATANDVGRIPEPLVSRLAVYEIEAPDAEGAARIARTIYGEIRNRTTGAPVPRGAFALGAGEARLAAAARDAPRHPLGVRQRQGRRPKRSAPDDIQDSRGRKRENRFLEVSQQPPAGDHRDPDQERKRRRGAPMAAARACASPRSPTPPRSDTPWRGRWPRSGRPRG